MKRFLAFAALALATAGAVEALASERGVGYSPPAFAISQFLRSDGKEIRRVRWPMDLSAEPWAPGAPPGTPPVDYDAYYRRYGIAGTPAVAALHGVVQGKWDWAVAASPHHGNYDTALEWACRERPGLLGRATSGEWDAAERRWSSIWDCKVTARELEDATATGGIAVIYKTWRVATNPPPPPPDPPPPVPPPVPPPPPPPATSCPEVCPSKQWGWPQCQPCPCPEGIIPGPRPWGQVHCTPAEVEEPPPPPPPPPPVRTCIRATTEWTPVIESTAVLRLEIGECPPEVEP